MRPVTAGRTIALRIMSEMGHSLRIHPASEPTFVRSYSKSDQKWCVAANDAKCRFCCKSRRWEEWSNRLDVLRACTAPAPFGGGAFEAVALTTATLTQHKQRRLVVA